jgi:flagellar biosynthetic protein FliO
LADNRRMDGSGALPGFGGSLAISLVSLGVVCVVAWVSLRFLGRRGFGRANGPIKVVARCPLEPRRALYVVETAGRCFLIGVGDGPMTMLAELGAEAVKATLPEPSDAGSKFAEVMARVLGRRDSGTRSP